MMVEPKTSIEWPLTAEHESSQGPFLYAGSCVQQGLFFISAGNLIHRSAEVPVS